MKSCRKKLIELKKAGIDISIKNIDALNKEAISYYQDLKTAWGLLLKEHVLDGFSVDNNPVFQEFAENFDIRFRKLNPYQKMVVTYNFVQGAEVTYMPPSSKRKAEISVIDSELLGLYYQKYNEAIDTNMLTTSDLVIVSPKNILAALCK